MHLLDNAHAQAVITVDYGSGLQWNSIHTKLVAPFTNSQPQEAAAWVAYANGDASLYGTLGDITIGVDALGNDWKTVGFWAKLRSSTLAQYQSWAGASYNSDNNFLAINHPTPVGIKYLGDWQRNVWHRLLRRQHQRVFGGLCRPLYRNVALRHRQPVAR